MSEATTVRKIRRVEVEAQQVREGVRHNTVYMTVIQLMTSVSTWKMCHILPP